MVWLEAQRASPQIPGVSAAIVRGQQVLWAGGHGFADRDAGRPADAESGPVAIEWVLTHASG